MGFQSSRSKQKSEPWKEQQPYLKEIFEGGKSWYEGQQPLQGSDGLRQGLFNRARYMMGGSMPERALGAWTTRSLAGPGETPVDTGSNPFLSRLAGSQGRNEAINRLMAPQETNPYRDRVANWATGGSAPSRALFERGEYNPMVGVLSGRSAINPYTDAMFGNAARGVTDQFRDAVLPGLNATFGNAGATGGSAHALAAGEAAGDLADTLSGLAGDVYGRAYESGEGRRLQGDIAAAGLLDSAAGRRLSRDESAARLGLEGLSTAGGLGASDLDRALSALVSGGQFSGQDLDRNTRALMHAADTAGRDLDRFAGAAEGARGRDLSRQLGAAGQVPGISELERARVGDVSQYSDDPYRNLVRYSNLLQMSPIMASQGSSKSKGFSL